MGKINTIEFAKLMMKKLDQQAVIGATSGWMEANAGQVEYKGGDEVKIPTMSTAGLADYDRDNGFVQGGISLTWKPYTMTQDRGRGFQIDDMDFDESGFVTSVGNVLKTFQEERVVPEIDGYRYSKIASEAKGANQLEEIAITEANVLSKLREHIRTIQDELGLDTQLVISMTSEILAKLEDSPKIGKSINVADFKQGGIDFRVKTLDGNPIKVVPSARFMTLYDIFDGTTAGQEDGGLKANEAAQNINWLITPANVPLAISKTDKIRIFAPGINQDADAWKVQYRKYHDLWILQNKLNQIMACVAPK